MVKRYNFCGTLNMRDIGGYPAGKSGGYTKPLRFIRCDAPKTLDNDEKKFFMSNNIKTVIDLRTEYEMKNAACAFASYKDFDYYHKPMIDNDMFPRDENSVGDLYMSFIKKDVLMREIFATLAGSDGGVIYHCSAGKDRTGVISAILLMLAEVDIHDIIANYMVSFIYLREIVLAMRKQFPEMPGFMGQSQPEYIESFILLFKEKYGSAAEYLSFIGLSDEEILLLRKKLLS